MNLEPRISTRQRFGGCGWVAQWERDLETYAWGEGETEEEAVRNLRELLVRLMPLLARS